MSTSTFEHHSTRDHVVRAALITTIGLLFWGRFDPDHKDLIRHLDDAVLFIFICEVAARLKAEIKARGWRFWRNGWLMFDLVVTVVAALPMGADVIAARVVRVAKLGHMGRHLPHLMGYHRYLAGLRAIKVLRVSTMRLAACAVAALVVPAGTPDAHADNPDPLAGITVAPHVKRYDYRRGNDFGTGWPDDGNGCDVRNDVLNRDLVDKTYVSTSHCWDAVETGTLVDPYSGKTLVFQRGEQTSATVQIDHIVALAWAWSAGAYGWSSEQRHRFYADPAELLAVSGKANDVKADYPPSEYWPPNPAYSCTYATKWIGVLREYALPIDPASADVLRREAATCPTT
jgi:Protein of unknown function (DUF1524)